jgi:hypothetical protein
LGYGSGIHFLCVISCSLAIIRSWHDETCKSTNPANPANQLDTAQAQELTRALNMITGVVKATISLDGGIAYLKVNNTILDKSALQSAIQTFVRD